MAAAACGIADLQRGCRENTLVPIPGGGNARVIGTAQII
jgi:hypothetical protein